MRISKSIFTATFGAVVALAGPLAGKADADASYTLTDLGTGVLPTGISASGQIFGTAAGQAYLYKNGQAIPIPGLSSGDNVVGVNNSGQTTGDLANGHAYLDSGGTVTDLGTLGGLVSGAGGINNKGQVVGNSEASGGNYSAFLYDRAEYTAWAPSRGSRLRGRDQ